MSIQKTAEQEVATINHLLDLNNGYRVKFLVTEEVLIVTLDGGCTVVAPEPVKVKECLRITQEHWLDAKGKKIDLISEIKHGMQLRRDLDSQPLNVIMVSCGKVVMCEKMCSAKFITLSNADQYQIVS